MNTENSREQVQVVWLTTDGQQHQTAFTSRIRADEVSRGIVQDYGGRIDKLWLQGRLTAEGNERPDDRT